jgi:hypothetical protein
MRKNYFFVLLPLFLSVFANASSAPPLTYFYSRTNGTFETSIWSSTGHADASCSCNPGCTVASNTVIYISHTVVSNCANIELGSNTTLVIESGGSLIVAGSGSITGGGNVQVNSGGLLELSGSLSLTGTGSATIEGTLNVYGNITATGSAAAGGICGTGNVNVGGSAQTGVVCGSIVLPVEFSEFYAVPEKEKISLFWTTSSESNNRGFDVERSKDGIEFSKIVEQLTLAPNGNSNTTLVYEVTDPKPLLGMAYYRVRQFDISGNSKYSQIVSVETEKNKNITFTVYPNPNQGKFTVDFTGVENNHEIEITMFDQQGKLVYNNKIYSESLATNTFNVIPDEAIANGVYFVNFTLEGINYPVKVIVN